MPTEIARLTAGEYQTRLGRYFTGQTGLLTFGDGRHAWGGLFNPADSGVRLYLNTLAVTNASAVPFCTEVWLQVESLGRGMPSRHVASANQAVQPVPVPKAELRDADRREDSPRDGLFSFLHIAEPRSTVVRDDLGGVIILPPGGCTIARHPSDGRVGAKGACRK